MSNQTIEMLKTRRAIRQYKPEQISDAELQTVLEAGTYAPTARNIQSPWIIAVQNEGDLETVKKLNAEIMGVDFDPYYGAPTVVLVVAPATEFGVIDSSAVLCNMANAAHAIGLATCWVHRPREMFETGEGKELLSKWGIPEGMAGVGSLALGYADCEVPAATPRKENYYRVIK